MAGQSYLVRRLTDNPDGIFYMVATRARHPNGMPLWSPSSSPISRPSPRAGRRAAQFQGGGHRGHSPGRSLRLDHRRRGAGGPRPQSAQVQCGGEVACPSCGKPAVSPFPDQARLEGILGPAAYKALYRGTPKGGSVRNKLVHGSIVPAGQFSSCSRILMTMFSATCAELRPEIRRADR